MDETSLDFFKDIYPSVTATTYDSGSDDFAKILEAITTYADSFVAIAQKYTPTDGALAEQFDRNSGTPLSARDLTWSYAAFVTMAERRDGQHPPSWGAGDVAAPPSTCSGTSTPGVYVPAVAAGAPNGTTPCQVNIKFNVNASTYFGESINIIGSTEDLGEWNIASSLPLDSGEYTSERPLWSISAHLAAGEEVNYKYVRQQNCGQPSIYETNNRTLTVPACGGQAITVEDAWVGPVGHSGGC